MVCVLGACIGRTAGTYGNPDDWFWMAVWGDQWEMAAVSHWDRRQRNIRVTLCPVGQYCQPSQPHSKLKNTRVTRIPIPRWTQSFTSFQLSDEGAKRLKRDVDASFPYAETAAVTVLTPRKVTHLLVRQNEFHAFQRFRNTPAQMSKHLSSAFRSVQSKRLAAWRSPARCGTCRPTPRSKSALVCGTAPCWRWVSLRLHKWLLHPRSL